MKKACPKIHIIANCASRKRLPAIASLGSIPKSNLEKRAKIWWKKLNNFPAQNSSNRNLLQEDSGKLKARDLYIGNYWSTVRQLPQTAQSVNFEPHLWVISAGYGLISADDLIHSYSATFTQGDENSVIKAEGNAKKRKETLSYWWHLISNYSLPESVNPRSLTQLIKTHPNDHFLIVASSDYLSAIEKDLLDGTKFLSTPENLVIVTSKSFSNDTLDRYLIPSDARLQCTAECADNCDKHLIPRGVRNSISSALALKIIEKVNDWGFTAPKIKSHIEKLVEKSPALIQYNRSRLDDREVSEFIERELKNFPSASHTYLLRQLRDSGLACEQKRFKELYWDAKRSIK